MGWIFANFRYKVLAVVLSLFVWVVAQGSASIERGYDIPVVLKGISDELVATEQSADEINVRVMGGRVALNNVSPQKLEYVVEVSGAKPGVSDFEVDVSRLDLPRGVRPVSRSPSQLDVRFERRATRAVRVRPDIEGEPAAGFAVSAVGIEPARVEITGARSEVLRLSEVVTEAIDISGAQEAVEREVRVALGGRHVWQKAPKPVRVRVQIEPVEPRAGEQPEGAQHE